jgi:large subunit ribosomal protein L3
MAGCAAATAATMSGLVTSFSSLSVSKPQQSSSCCSSSLTLRSSFLAKATTQQQQQLSEIETLALDIRSVRKGSRNGSRGVVRMGPLEAGVGLMGTKMGMMTVFTADGIAIPCTVVGFHEGNIVTQVKSEATDGYTAVQVGYRRVRDRKLTKPERGHLEKVGAIPMRHLQEFRVVNTEGYEPNQRLVLEDIFKDGDLIDVVGNSIGKGFAGVFLIFSGIEFFFLVNSWRAFVLPL